MDEKVIYKYEMIIDDEVHVLTLPTDSKIIHVDIRNSSTLQFWVIQNPSSHNVERRTFKVVGTGHRFSNLFKHVGTVKDEPFVWHLLEETG